jgi:hypothetical protein
MYKNYAANISQFLKPNYITSVDNTILYRSGEIKIKDSKGMKNCPIPRKTKLIYVA